MALIDLLIWGPEVSATRDVERRVRDLGDIQRESGDALGKVQNEVRRVGENLVQALRQESRETRELLAIGLVRVLEALQAQTAILSDILQRLSDPERTKAREKQRDGVHAFNSGMTTGQGRWFDDAVKDFKAAVEIDRYDSISYFFLGMIYAFAEGAKREAGEAFGDAAHYAWPDEARRSAAALLGVALCVEDPIEAERAAREACTRDPTLAAARLILAKCLALLHRCENACAELRQAILLEPEYFADASVDPTLQTCPQLDALLDELLLEARRQAEPICTELDGLVERAKNTILRFAPEALPEIGPWESVVKSCRRSIVAGDYVMLRHIPVEQGNWRGSLVARVRQILEGAMTRTGYSPAAREDLTTSIAATPVYLVAGFIVFLVGGLILWIVLAIVGAATHSSIPAEGIASIIGLLAGVVVAFGPTVVSARRMKGSSQYRQIERELSRW